MADAYLKVKDNGAQGLALMREETDVSINELKTQIKNDREEFALDTTYWQRKGLNSGTGTTSSADSTTRLSTKTYIDTTISSVYPKTGYEIAVYAWDSSEVYQGVWNGTEFVKTGITWFNKEVLFGNFSDSYYIKILARLATNTDIELSECTNIVFAKQTDDTLTIKRIAADAKATGDAIKGLRSLITKKYATVSDMISDTDIANGEYVETLGYGAVHDGMGMLYHIVDQDYAHTGYEALSNGLYAIPQFNLSVDNHKPSANVDKMIEVGESFLGCGHSFTYGHDTAIDSTFVSNTYVIDCSAFAWFLMNGCTFENSKYNGKQQNTRCIGAPEIYTPPFTGTTKIRSANSIAKYFAYQGLAYLPNSDMDNLRAGDIVFFSNNEYTEEPERFMNIDHVCVFLGKCEQNNGNADVFQVIGNSGDMNNPEITTFFTTYTRSKLNKIVMAAACPFEPISRISDGNIVVNGDTPVTSESASLLNEYDLNHLLESYTMYTIDLETDQTLPMLYFVLDDADYRLYVNGVSISTIYPTTNKLHIHFITNNIDNATIKNKIKVYTSSHSGNPITISRFAMERGWK